MDDTDVTVAANRDVGPDAVALELDTPAGFDARPGQFVKLTATVPGDSETGDNDDGDSEQTSRFYTISSPTVAETFEVTLTVDPAGTFGPYLAALEPGDTVTVTGPFGSAAYDGETATLVVAGGPGVGPAVAIAERTLDDGGDAAVVYQDDAPIHADRLDALRDRGAHVAVIVTDADLTDAVADALEPLDDPTAFVYGFSGFLEDAVAALEAAGIDRDDARTESFGPEPGGD